MTVIHLHDRGFKGGKSKSGVSAKKLSNPSREEILLLRLADKIDEIIMDAVLEHELAASEVAALLAHRLGHLVLAMPTLPGAPKIDRDEFLNYLTLVLRREAGDPEAELQKSS